MGVIVMARLTCLRCGAAMETGFVFNDGHNSTGRAWVKGRPRRGRLGFLKLPRDDERVNVTTYRCPKCGYLESYAPTA